jgi:valyl-tRNA synthetase
MREAKVPLIVTLARLERLDWLAADAEPAGAAVAPLGEANVWVPLAGLVDVGAELARLNKTKAKLEKEIGKLSKRLANPQYRANAPEAVVARAEAELNDLKARLAEVESAAGRLEALAE